MARQWQDMLAHLPPFPLIVKHADMGQCCKVTAKDEEDLLLALQHWSHSPLLPQTITAVRTNIVNLTITIAY